MKPFWEFLAGAALIWFVAHSVAFLLIQAYEFHHPTQPQSEEAKAERRTYSNRCNWCMSLGALTIYIVVVLVK